MKTVLSFTNYTVLITNLLAFKSALNSFDQSYYEWEQKNYVNFKLIKNKLKKWGSWGLIIHNKFNKSQFRILFPHFTTCKKT